ncbi:MAG: RHS repeat-associated core domain-containing protein, partial [Ktedonobacterales bacterium]
VTGYTYDATGRLASITQPGGTTIAFTYDGDGNRLSKTITSGGTTTAVKDVYQLGHVAYETDNSGTVLASFSYDSQGVPTSVRVGSDPTTAPVYYYVYNGHGDTMALTDATGAVVASYTYDAWGVVTSDTEAFSNGWHNPYLYDGRDGARYDGETGLYWLAVRAYDPTLGRFLSRDPLGRAPLFGWADQPYVYAGNNPLVNVDPSWQRFATEGAAQSRAALGYQRRAVARMVSEHRQSHAGHVQATYNCNNVCVAKQYANKAGGLFSAISVIALGISALIFGLLNGVAPGLGLFVGTAAAAALVTFGGTAMLAAYQFGQYDENRGPNPAYFASYQQAVANAIGLPAAIVSGIGTLFTFIFGKPLAALLGRGLAFTSWLETAGSSAAFRFNLASISVGLLIGALAALLILSPVAAWFTAEQYDLLFGTKVDCGNNDFGTDEICPAGEGWIGARRT